MPVMQWMYFDSIECLPEEENDLPESNFQPVNSRYDAQIAVFGQEFQKRIVSKKYFIVGLVLVINFKSSDNIFFR